MLISYIIKELEEFIESDEESRWIIGPEVFCDGDWAQFRKSFEACSADFLATEIRTWDEDEVWPHWKSLLHGGNSPHRESCVAALLPLTRFSLRAAKAVLSGLQAGWSGHPEALIPTIVRLAGLTIEDIGGSGSFTPSHRTGRWYDRSTWHWRGPVQHKPGMLHFPIDVKQRVPASARLSSASRDLKVTASSRPRLLYVCPVGAGAAGLISRVTGCFLEAHADCWLIQYDDAILEIPPGARHIKDAGFKFPLAIRHLHPELVSDYDYIFIWDDDIDPLTFEPQRFVEIMRFNKLDMAQPAIQSAHGISHEITRHRPCPAPWRLPDGTSTLRIAGRLSSFVEIMVPVFTRESWREFYRYLDPSNKSGWGYDYIPLGRKGIVDTMPVVHTRAVQSINGASKADLRRFLDDNGLFLHPPVEHGWLFEEWCVPALRGCSEK